MYGLYVERHNTCLTQYNVGARYTKQTENLILSNHQQFQYAYIIKPIDDTVHDESINDDDRTVVT